MEEKKIYFNYLPSLLHIASVKIVTYLLKDPDIGEKLDKTSPITEQGYEPWRIKLWNSIEKTAEEKLPPLPPFLGNKVVKLIHPMLHNISEWLTDHSLDHFDDYYYYIKFINFCWKSDGRIDRDLTAKQIILNKAFSLSTCFTFACQYYFTHDIIVIWDKIKKKKEKKVFREGSPPVKFWVKYLKKGHNESMDDLTKKYFNPANVEPKDGNIRLISYFSFLPREFRQEYLQNRPEMIHDDDFILCLNKMDKSERTELFLSEPVEFLYSCIKWPFYSFLIKAVNEFSSYLTLEDYEDLLDKILIDDILEGWDRFEIFKEFWNVIPDSDKEEIKKNEKKFNIIKETLNHDKINQPESLKKNILNYYFTNEPI